MVWTFPVPEKASLNIAALPVGAGPMLVSLRLPLNLMLEPGVCATIRLALKPSGVVWNLWPAVAPGLVRGAV